MAQRIPTYQSISADFQQVVELDGQLVTLRFIWNVRSGHWYLDLTDQLGGVVRVKVVPRWPLLKQYYAQTSLVGDLLVLPVGSSSPVITYDSLGTEHQVFFVTPAELVQWEVANGIRA